VFTSESVDRGRANALRKQHQEFGATVAPFERIDVDNPLRHVFDVVRRGAIYRSWRSSFDWREAGAPSSGTACKTSSRDRLDRLTC